MRRPPYIHEAITRTYKLESLLRILSLAVDGEQIAGTTFVVCGGGTVIDLAADMAGEIMEGLEIGDSGKAA